MNCFGKKQESRTEKSGISADQGRGRVAAEGGEHQQYAAVWFMGLEEVRSEAHQRLSLSQVELQLLTPISSILFYF